MDGVVFISGPVHPVTFQLLEEAGLRTKKWKEDRRPSQEEVIENCQEACALISLVRDKLDAFFFKSCPQLRAISNYAVGFENIDLSEANRRRIPIGYTPEVLSNSTAELTIALLLACSRNILSANQAIRRGEWTHFDPMKHLGTDLSGKTLGIFGMGRIGSLVAKKARLGFDMEIIYNSRNRNEEVEDRLGAAYVSWEDLLESSDFLSAHCPITERTAGIFNKQTFQRMKSTAFFINAARGGIHVEEDLIQALNQREIAGSGLDVTNPEPMRSDNPLLSMSNVVVTPHIGSATMETRKKMGEICAHNIIQGLSGKPMIHTINPNFV
ncbi:2-hydroxyacid dehydrogenase [Poritiphilus flavus]|uniref:Glyoxylate/hydroxypyruvate reductase B n=1 Tax=Poritiphilus flavus TaxID=2697053 RepID=A0A6L9E7S5_9FLAO|nr:D-glycerate dehydrogenase [Poritiphilus flavus]NAS10613.1 D-glycerate dehydrogenase [Poritiphilus flavus]